MAVEPRRHFGPTGQQFTPWFTPSSLRDRGLPPKIHNIRNRPIPQPPGFDPQKPYGYLNSHRPGVRLTIGRVPGPAPRPLTLAEVIRRVAASFGGYYRTTGAMPEDYERVKYFDG